jgi:hypothetical protein
MRRGAVSRSSATVALLAVVFALAATPSISAASVLAATPYMGWDTYFALGGRYSEATVLREASELKSLGLERRGYRYVWLDVGWWHGTRAPNGEITVSPAQWPHGLAWLTRALHAAGFRVGLYTDAGPNGCGGARQGSYGHYQQDVDTFALRCGQGRLLRRHRIPPRPGGRLLRVPRSDRGELQPSADAAVDLQLPGARTVRRRCAS